MDKYLMTKVEQYNWPDLLFKGYVRDQITRQFKKKLVCLLSEEDYDKVPDNLKENVAFCKTI